MYPLYLEYCKENIKEGIFDKADTNWMNSVFATKEQVKMDLFLRTGCIAGAGDRHLAEFCPGSWYLPNPERVDEMGFALTPVSWRKKDMQDRIDRGVRLASGEEKPVLKPTGEEGVLQMRALLGLHDFVTNVNIPNIGQISNLPLGAIVETNAHFANDMVTPVISGDVPSAVNQLVSKICNEQQQVLNAVQERDLDKAFIAFCSDPLVTCSLADARKMFDEMVDNTKKYLTMYNI